MRVEAMRATCGVMSARTPIILWVAGSMTRNAWSCMAPPAPASSPSSNSSSGGLTRS